MKPVLGILGCGNMGGAIASRVKAVRFGFDRNPEKVKSLGLIATKDAHELIQKCDTVIIAIKPQDFRKLDLDFKDKLVISIMAGVPLKDLPRRAIRAMPNLGVMVGKGVIAWTAGKGARAGDKILARKIFSEMGAETEVRTDDDIDKMTAIFSCSPAFFYLFMQALSEAGREFGFNKADLRWNLDMLIKGSLEVAGGQDFTELITKVASKGGMTEAGLKVLGKKWQSDLKKAIRAAYKRAKALSKE